LKPFDKKFGENFLSEVPASPGTYRMWNEAGILIYVGKAKNLKRRLAQYKNARKGRRQRRMQKVLKQAVRINFEVAISEYAALLRELDDIQEFRPHFNIAGAYSFLYPQIGVLDSGKEIFLCVTTLPEHYREFEFYGCFRSRKITRDAFFSLLQLLRFIGHSAKANKKFAPRKYSHVVGFRRLPEPWLGHFRKFLRGETNEMLEWLSLTLLEKPAARAQAEAVQESLEALKKLWRWEILPLERILSDACHDRYPVSQLERDRLFLKAKYQKEGLDEPLRDIFGEHP
jgi:hypothetical protein